jgi:hypothetical protein
VWDGFRDGTNVGNHDARTTIRSQIASGTRFRIGPTHGRTGQVRVQDVIDARSGELDDADRREAAVAAAEAHVVGKNNTAGLMASNESLTGKHGTPPATASGDVPLDVESI